MIAVVGIDPGGAETGIVLRNGDRCEAATVVVRGPDETMASYLGRVIDTTATYHCRIVGHQDGRHVAVEDLNPPNPHMGITSVRGLLGTAQVLGAILLHWPTATLVPPGGNGSGPLAAYPEALRPTRGQGRGRDRMRHCRSAFDVAGAASRYVRLQGATT